MSDEAMDQDTKSKAEVQNGEKPAGKKALLMPRAISLKEQADKIVEIAEAELDVKEDVSNICSEVKKLKQLADAFISVAMADKLGKDAAKEFQYVAKVQGLRPEHFKDMRNILQNAIGMGTVKFSPMQRNSPFVEINFTSEEVMNKGLKFVRNKPLGLTLCVVETRKVAKSHLPPESVLDPVAAEFDPIIMHKESLLRSRELTEEEYNRMLGWKEKFIQHVLAKMCDKLDPDVTTVVKDRTEGYFFKLEGIRSTVMLSSESERYQTYTGVNPETGKVEMGYWGLGSDVPSRIPRSAVIRDIMKVLTDFMESSGKPFYDLRVRKGYWDSIMIRANHEGQCMVVLVVHVEANTDGEKECKSLKPLLVELFETGDGKDCGVKSIHMKTLTDKVESAVKGKGGKSGGKAGAWFLVYGEEHLDEEVAGLKVRLYKNTFFWGDGGCTEQLCETIVEELGLREKSGVLEMGVATGLICMYLAKRCKMVVGLDRVQSVLPMARGNVDLNDLKNVELVQGGPSTTVASLKSRFKDCEDVYAVVTETSSNSRSKEEIVGMRKESWIKKVAYLIISYKDVTSSLKLMCSKNADSSEPFVITKVIPFDVASTNVRPDILLLLERASVLEGQTEKRVPKAKPAQSPGGPPAKKARMNPPTYGAGQRPRSLLAVANRKFGGSPQMPTNRGFSGRGGFSRRGSGFSQNQQRNSDFRRQGDSMYPWSQGENPRSQMMAYNSEAISSMRAAAAEEEALMMERVRRQKELQLQQIQEAMVEAQRRRLADSLMPSPSTQNIEEVVLSAIKKTGLLEKVSALTDAPAKPQIMDIDSAHRDTDRWSSNFNKRAADDQPSFNTGFQGRDSAAFLDRDHEVAGYQDRDTFGYQGRDTYQERDASGFQGRDTYQDRDVSGFQNRDSFQDRGLSSDSMYNSSRGYYGNASYSSRYGSQQ